MGAHNAFLILRNQKQIIREKHRRCSGDKLGTDGRQEIKRSEVKTLGLERTVRDRRGTRETDRVRAGQGEDVMKRREKKNKRGKGEDRRRKGE